jgi:hypothetical protein
MRNEQGCRKPEEHHQHLCVLKNRLDKAELAGLISQPRFVCGICGGRTRRGGNLCQPKKLRQ